MKIYQTLITTAVVGHAILISIPAKGLVFTQWDFNNSNLTPNIGVGTASHVGGTATRGFNSGAGSTDPNSVNFAWNTNNYPTQGTNNKTAGVQFSTSTVGFENIIINWDQRNSATASAYTQFQYSVDGINFVDSGSPLQAGGNSSFNNSNSIDLSSITNVNNNPNFSFRLVSAFDPNNNTSYTATNNASTYRTVGTWRFDMVTINGDVSATPVPFNIPGGSTIPTFGSLLVLGIIRKAVQ
ncbi:MAG: PEP-CTERM sorting domain-containing protein [Sphaerospermopsis sp. SIO1G2]|nr:PEP-CTERM sorting domain-containing protein [Sphaerospermopsis sp. SIO1G2]